MNLKEKFFQLFQSKTQHLNIDELNAGTGFMLSLSDSISYLQKKGYTENLVPEFDHFTARSGEMKINPKDFFIDEIVRFEVASDPDDNSILYAITCEKENIKGLYVESYGTYHDELSSTMLARIKFCREQRKTPKHYAGKPQSFEPEGPA
ncbi:MAG: hypothetical protein H7061_03905 [Bdellovibrionaceae bacterium]|nr:hypothetical protein [Bdellovibrio sp.]